MKFRFFLSSFLCTSIDNRNFTAFLYWQKREKAKRSWAVVSEKRSEAEPLSSGRANERQFNVGYLMKWKIEDWAKQVSLFESRCVSAICYITSVRMKILEKIGFWEKLKLSFFVNLSEKISAFQRQYCVRIVKSAYYLFIAVFLEVFI